MIVFVSGGAKSGKSALAQDIAVQLSREKPRYYMATLVSTGAEDDDRIRRHLEDRKDLQFETVECFGNVLDCLQSTDPTGTFLLDSVTSLLQNVLFPPEQNYRMDLAAASRCQRRLIEFADRVGNVIFVSDYIYSDAEQYSESTEAYRRCLAGVDRALAAISDVVLEVYSGQVTVHKGEKIR